MVSQAVYHAHHSDGKRPGHAYSPYMPANRYTESRMYVPNSDHRGLLSDSLEKAEGTTRKRIAVACGRCRQRKIRCSGDKGQSLPCTNCDNAGISPCLFLRVSSREATIKPDFDYNTEISRSLAHRATVPLPPLLSSNGSYGTVASDFNPGGAGDAYRTIPSLYPFNHKAYYNSLPQSPWTPGYIEDCDTPADYAAPQPCSPYAVVSDHTSQLVAPFTWDGRTAPGPPPPPLTLKVQAPGSAPTLSLTSVSSLPPPPAQSHVLDQPQSQGQGQHHDTQAQNASHCHCNNCVQGHAHAHAHAQASATPVGTPKLHTDQISSQDHDAGQYNHGQLVYRPGLTGGNDGASSDFHQVPSMQSAHNNSSNNCEATVQLTQAVSMSRAPSHGSLADHSAAMTMSRFKQEMMSSRSSASSPAPMQSSMHITMASLPPLSLSSHAHMVGSVSPAGSPYAGGHASAASSTDSLVHVNYSTTPVSERANDGSIFSDQERHIVGNQGPGPVACLDSYTYGSGPVTTSKILPSSSSSSLHGVYGRQNKKKLSTDSLVKTRPYSPAEGPMLPPSHHHGHGHAYIKSSRQPGTPVCGSPSPMHSHGDLQTHEIKVEPGYESHR